MSTWWQQASPINTCMFQTPTRCARSFSARRPRHVSTVLYGSFSFRFFRSHPPRYVLFADVSATRHNCVILELRDFDLIRLYGGILHQAYRYFRTYHSDRLVLKLTVRLLLEDCNALWLPMTPWDRSSQQCEWSYFGLDQQFSYNVHWSQTSGKPSNGCIDVHLVRNRWVGSTSKSPYSNIFAVATSCS